MPARDKFHQAVRTALEKEGWRITSDPLKIEFGDIEVYIDLGAENLLAAEKNGQQIAVEIKSFIGSSAVSDYHTALGQFINYRMALNSVDPHRVLYLAIPEDAFKSFFRLRFADASIRLNSLKLVVYNAETEAITQWIN